MSTENNQLTIWIRNMKTSREAFEALYNEMGRPMYTVACRILKNRADAEDIVQDVFLKLLKRDDGEAIDNVRAYILQTVRNEALMLLRKRSKEELRGEIPEDVPEGETETENAENRTAVLGALSALEPTERDIFTLHVNGELGFEEIAGMLGMSLSAVYRRYRKAIKKLRSRIGGNL